MNTTIPSLQKPLPQHPDIGYKNQLSGIFHSWEIEQERHATPTMALYSCLDDKELRFLSERAITRKYNAKSQIVSENDDTTSLYIIKKGLLKVTKRNHAGKEVILAVLRSGNYFGEIALIDGGLRSTNVLALTPTELTLLRRKDVLFLLNNNPKLALHIMGVLTSRLRAATNKIESLALMNVYNRIVNLFNDMAKARDGLLSIDDPFTQQDIADMVGASREMVSRIFTDLVKGGYISIRDKRIVIKKRLPAAW